MVSHICSSDLSQPQVSTSIQNLHRETEDQEELDQISFLAKTEYTVKSAKFRKRLVFLRETRAVLDRKQRMRKEKAARLSYQFKTILCQMKQTQKDAAAAQERNMKLLGFHELQQQTHSEQRGFELEHDSRRSGFEAAKATLQQEEIQKADRTPTDESCAGLGVLIRIPKMQKATYPRQIHLDRNDHSTVSSGSQKDLIVLPRFDGTSCPLRGILTCSFSKSSNMRGSGTESAVKKLPCNSGKLSKSEEEPYDLCNPSNLPAEAANVRRRGSPRLIINTSFFDCREVVMDELHEELLDSPAEGEMIHNGIEKKPSTKTTVPKQNVLQPRIESHQDLPLAASLDNRIVILEDDTDRITLQLSNEGFKGRDVDEDRSSSKETTKQEDCYSSRIGVETATATEQKNPVMKIGRSDFFPDVDGKFSDGRKVEDSRESTYRDALAEEVGKVCTEDIEIEVSIREDILDQGEEENVEFSREAIAFWSQIDKLSILATLKNTMCLWEDQSAKFGCWPESHLLLSCVYAAKDSQRKLFEYLESMEGISRPLACCGAVYELVQSYPPEKLIPPRFFADFFTLDDSRRHLQSDGFGNKDLEENYHEELEEFWEMLIQHSLCVKDLGLGTLQEVAAILGEILCPRRLLEELPPQTVTDLRDDLLNFLLEQLRGSEDASRANSVQGSDGDPMPLSHNFFIPVEKGISSELTPLHSFQVERSQDSVRDVVVADGLELSLMQYDSMKHSKGGSARIRTPRKGIFSSIGSLVRNPLRLWRSRGMSKAADGLEDGCIRLLSPKRSCLRLR